MNKFIQLKISDSKFNILLLVFIIICIPNGSHGQDLSFTSTKIADQDAASSIEIGPDGNLYVGDADGTLVRYLLDEKGFYIGTSETLLQRQGRILGLDFDPLANENNLILWACTNPGTMDSESHAGALESWKSKIIKITIPWIAVQRNIKTEDIIVGLPTGFHEANGIEFGPDGNLYIAQGSMTTGGYPSNDNKFDNRNESKLSAAILSADVKNINPPLDVTTGNGGNYNPSDNSPVQTFATGIRNPYGLTWHDGVLYSASNQSDNGFNLTGPCGNAPVLKGYRANEPFMIVKKGVYYGFPNPRRNECILMGGNTGKGGPWQIDAYPKGTQPEDNFDASFLLFNMASMGEGSPDGMISYNVPGPLQGRIVIAGFSSGRLLSVVFNQDRTVKSVEPIKKSDGSNIQIQRPLDVALHPNGNLYVASFGEWGSGGKGGAIHMVKPNQPADPVKVAFLEQTIQMHDFSFGFFIKGKKRVYMSFSGDLRHKEDIVPDEVNLISLEGKKTRLKVFKSDDSLYWRIPDRVTGIHLLHVNINGKYYVRKFFLPRN